MNNMIKDWLVMVHSYDCSEIVGFYKNTHIGEVITDLKTNGCAHYSLYDANAIGKCDRYDQVLHSNWFSVSVNIPLSTDDLESLRDDYNIVTSNVDIGDETSMRCEVSTLAEIALSKLSKVQIAAIKESIGRELINGI